MLLRPGQLMSRVGCGSSAATRHIRTFAGVRADARAITGATTVAGGSTALTVAGAAFTSGDVAKLILVPGAGAAGAVLITTIAAVVSATQVTLAAAAGTALAAVSTTVAYGSDDRVAVQAAINGGDYTLDFTDTTLLIGSPGLTVSDANAIAPATRVSRNWVGPSLPAAMQGEGVTTWTALGFRAQQARLMFMQTAGTCIDVVGQGFSANGIWIDQHPADGSIGIRMSRADTFEDIDAYFRDCRFRNGLAGINPIGRGIEVKHCAFEGTNIPIDLDFPATINADTTLGQNPDSAWRAIVIADNRFHSIEQTCIRNVGAQAASIVGLHISDNHVDGGSVFRFFNGNVGKGTQFSGNRITGLIAGGSGVVITGGESVTFDDCHFASHVDGIAAETDWSNEAISFSGTVTDYVSITNCTFRRFLFRAINAANAMFQVRLDNNVFEDCTGTSNGTRSPIRFGGDVTDLEISGLTHFQTAGSAYAADILTVVGTLTRGFGQGWTYNTARHRAHNLPAFALARPESVVSVAGDYTTTPSDVFIRVTNTAAPRTITLSTARLEPGHPFVVKDSSGGAGTNNITVTSPALIDGVSSAVISANFGSRRFRWSGTTFEVI